MMHLNLWLTVSLMLLVGTPVVVAVMSFVSWENGFKVLGWKRIVRMQIASVGLFSLGYFLANWTM